MKSYEYDVFLSFTGADREVKNQIRQYLKSIGMSSYDSDLYCKGRFREDFCQAIDKSRVYLLILTDSLRRIPTEGTAETLTEVRREVSLACKLESHNELNIVILCMSEFFRFDRPFHDRNDQLGSFFYDHIQGFSQIRGSVDESGLLVDVTLDTIGSQCRSFIENRNAGTPIISQAPHYEIATEKLMDRGLFVGREGLIEAARREFGNGRQAVVLTGMGGIGKTTLAVEIARQCEEDGLKCLQMVHINEVAHANERGDAASRDAFRTFVSTVTYTAEVYDTLRMLADRDRHERRMSALRALPENVLLVVDNINDLTENDLREMLTKLKCRLLITTRANIAAPSDDATVLSVDSLDTDDAFEMFCKISGVESDRTSFDGLYRSVGGHTITLCIMARLMAMHKMSLATLISEMGELEAFDARVDFQHNEYGDSDTVMGHLEKLFGISEFGEIGCRILRSMSILANGTVPVRDLMEMLALRNRNEIIGLTRSGWLELQTREENGDAQEYLYLHPILSRLMAKQLTPTEENVAEMIAYLARKCDEARSSMTYADATLLEDGLYYACYVLAGGSRRLSHDLWSRFVEVNHLLGNVEETARKTEQLAARISDTDTRSVITAYADMITLEQFPTRVEILDKYLGTLKHNARDYKWVMRSLSVTLPHICGIEKFRPFLLSALERAIDAAMAQEDDFSLLDLFAYYMVATKDVGALFRRMRAYVRMRKKKGKESGALVYLDLLLSGSALMAAKNASEYISKTLASINDIMNDGGSKAFFKMLLHPIAFSRVLNFRKRIQRLDSDDPVALPLSIISGEVDRFVNDGQFDAATLIEAAVYLYQMRLERQTTLTSASDAVRGFLQMLHAFPEDIVRRGTGGLVDRVDMSNVSVQSLSNLQVAMLINREFNNREAIAQAKQVIDVLRHLYPEGHGNILAAMISYGDVCVAFDDTETAMRAYAEAYRHMKRHSPDSAELIKLSQTMLRLPDASRFSADSLAVLYEAALTGVEELTSSALYLASHYLYRLFEKVGRGEMSYDDDAFGVVWDTFRRAAEAKKALAHLTAISFMRDIICGAAVYLINQKEFDRALALCKFLEPFCKSRKKELRINARIYISHIRFYADFHRGEETVIESGKAVVAACVRRRMLQRIASTDTMLMISHLSNRHMLPYESMIGNPDVRKNAETYADYFKNCCVTQKGLDLEKESEMERLRAARDFVFCDRLRQKANELYLKDMNISPKEYRKIRSADAFFGAVFENLTRLMIEDWHDKPIELKFNAPKEPQMSDTESEKPMHIPQRIEHRTPPRPRQVRMPYEDCRMAYSQKWQPDQLEELKEWLLASVCRFFASRPEHMEEPPDDPTGEWTELASTTWKELIGVFSEEGDKAIPALIFDGDAELTEKIRKILPTVGLTEDRAEEIAQYLLTCGGILPLRSDADHVGTDLTSLDHIAETQGYPRELFVFAGYVRCMRCDAIKALNINTLSDARALIEVGTDRSLSRLGYSGVNRFHPLDRYLTVSYFVNTRF